MQRLRAALQRLTSMPIERVDLSSPSPFCLPLMVERLRERLSTEQLKDRLERMLKQAEAQLDSSAGTVSSRRRPRR